MKKKFLLLGIIMGTSLLKAQVTTQTLSYTGSMQTFTVPAASCVTQVTITCYGAQGANGVSTPSGAIGGNGGLGAMISGVYSITGGDVLNVYVGGAATGSLGGFNGGGNGGNNTNGGGGGGATDIRFGGVALANRIIVAGGGGGGGNAGCASSTITGGSGGNSNGNGTAGINSQAGGGGQGGSGSTGGAAGLGCPLAMGTVGVNGSSGQGGTGGNGLAICGARVNGGGGGGGYVGGGGGGGGSAGTTSCTLNDQGGGGGGAGGTNYFNPAFTNTTVSNGVRTGNGLVVISYLLNASATSVSVSATSTAICAGASPTLTASGATSYTWSTSSNSTSIVVSPTATAVYSVSAITTNSLGSCTSTAAITVSVTAAPSISVVSSPTAICVGASSTLTASGATTYTWDTGPTTSTLNVSPSSTAIYTVVGTNTLGCNTTQTVEVTVNALPTLTVTDGAICNGSSFTISPLGASSYTYSGGSQIVSPTTTATYSVTGTDANGCVTSTDAVVSVTVNALPTLTVNSGAICTGNSFTISALGATSYTYSGGSAVVSPTADVTYSVTGTDANGCVTPTDAIVSVTVHALPTLTVNSGSICSGDNFTITPIGAISYTYSSGSAIVSPTANVSYTITGEDLNSCQNITVSTVTVNSLPTLTVNSGAICSGNSFTISPLGASSYTFSSGSAIVSPTANATYSVTGTDGNGCITATSVVSTVTVHALPTLTVNSGTICSGNNFTISPSGASTYTYSSGSAVVSPTLNATYTVTGTDANGCVTSVGAVSSVTVHALPVLTVNSGAICSGNNFTISPSGASTYTYSGGSAVVSPTTTTTYTVNGTDNNGCVTATGAISTVTVYALPTLTVNSGTICSGNNFTISPSGAVTYTYSSGTAIVSPITNTTYTITGTDINGCITSIGSISTVSVNTTPTVNISPASSTICIGDMVNLSAFGAMSYTWNTGSNFSLVSMSPTVTTTYSVVGASSNGCSGSKSITVTVNSLPVVTISSPVSICSGISTTITAGGAISYTWNTGSTSTNIVVSPTVITTYSVQGVDAAGCIGSAIKTLSLFTVPTVIANTSHTAVCSGDQIALSGSGAVTYTWSNGVPNGTNFVPSSTSSYTVTGTDANGCKNTGVTSVTVFTLPTVNLGADVDITVGNTHQFNPTVTNAVAYSWTPASWVSNSNILNPTTRPEDLTSYVLTVTSQDGCIAKDTVVISLSGELVIANYMSPNGDGINDTWKVSAPWLIKNYSVLIVDSQGFMVFSTSGDYANEWDGKIGGKDVPDGTYYYFLKDGRTVKYKGSITLTK